MNLTAKGNNFFFTQGTVISKKPERDGGVTLTVVVDEVYGKTTYPKVYVSKERAARVPIKLQAKYYFEGIVEGGNEQKGNKTFHTQRFYVTDVRPALRRLQDYATEHEIVQGSAFRSYLTGELVRIIDIDDGWGKIVLKMQSEGTPTYVRISYNKNLRGLPDMKELVHHGDYSAYCRISTPKKVVNGKTCTYCNLMLQQIEKIAG